MYYFYTAKIAALVVRYVTKISGKSTKIEGRGEVRLFLPRIYRCNAKRKPFERGV